MRYDNAPVRRRDRLLDEPQAAELLRRGEYGVLSMTGPDGRPYGIPLNYVWDGASAVYIHCAPEGRKLRAIEACPDVSFCVVGRTRPLPSQFTTEYESIVMKGKARTALAPGERMAALRLLVAKYSPGCEVIGERYAAGSFHRVEIIRIDIEEWSGKQKKVGGQDNSLRPAATDG